MTRAVRNRLGAGLTALAMVFAQIVMPAQMAFAVNGGQPVYDTPTDGKITICHRTNSVTNPYTQETISVDAADGLSSNSGNGANADHYSEHKGLVFDVSADPTTAYPTPRNGNQWGDIIPPVIPSSTLQGANTAGLNWNEAGMAIYYNDCNLAVRDATAVIGVTDPTCDNSSLASVTNITHATMTGTLDQSVGTHTATFNAIAGHLFSDGTAVKSVNYTILPVLTGEECEPEQPITIPLPSGISDVCGRGNDSVPMPTDGSNYTVLSDTEWIQDGNDAVNTVRTITYKANEGYVFASGEGWSLSEDMTQAAYTFIDWGTQCPSANECTVSDNMFIQPWTDGTYSYPYAGGAVPGTYEFKADGLHLSTPALSSYVFGEMTAGETPVSEIDQMGYQTYREVTSTGNPQTVTAYIISVDRDGNLSDSTDVTYLFYEPIYNGTVVSGEWQTWDVDADDAVLWSFELTGGNPTLTWSQFKQDYPHAVALTYGFNQGTYNQGTDARIQNLDFDCATTTFGVPGSGGIGEEEPVVPVAPVTPSTPVVPVVGGQGSLLPEELPMTGQNGSVLFTWIALLTAILTYGSVYYLQPKKRFEQ